MIVHCALLKCYTILGYSTETVLLIFPFLQTDITVQMRTSEGCLLLLHLKVIQYKIGIITSMQHLMLLLFKDILYCYYVALFCML